MWYLVRASGIVAVVLMSTAILWGFLFSSRDTGKRLRPAWWLDLHNWLGGLSLVFTAVHISASLLDDISGIGLTQVFVPGSSDIDKWALTWGVIAAYLLAIVVFTTWPKKLGKRRWWRMIHLSSVLAMLLALIHTYQLGTEISKAAYQAGFIVIASVATYGLALRIFALKLGKE